MRGMLFEVVGIVSATNNKNTVIDRNIVTPRDTFSPDSTGRIKDSTIVDVKNIAGITRLNK